MIKKIILWTLVIGCMIMIFSFSAQPATESRELSDSLLHRILQTLMVNADYETVEFLSVFIRKAAHFSVYAILGSLMFLTGREYALNGKRAILLPWLASFLYAVTDEVHQLFVEGRSGQLKDICIDSSGALTGIMIAWGIVFLFTRRKK